MFKDTPNGQTHSFNDGCGEPAHNNMPTPTTIETIEKEFSEIFSGILETKFKPESGKFPIPSITLFVEPKIKSFLHTALLRVREETLNEVREKAEGMDTGAYHDEDYVKGFNRFRDDLLASLK